MTEQLGMDPFLVYLIGLIALFLIGWLWIEYRWTKDQAEESIRQCIVAMDQRDRAINLAADLVEAIDKAGIDISPELPNHPPRTTGPAFRQNGGHLKRVQ